MLKINCVPGGTIEQTSGEHQNYLYFSLEMHYKDMFYMKRKLRQQFTDNAQTKKVILDLSFFVKCRRSLDAPPLISFDEES